MIISSSITHLDSLEEMPTYRMSETQHVEKSTVLRRLSSTTPTSNQPAAVQHRAYLLKMHWPCYRRFVALSGTPAALAQSVIWRRLFMSRQSRFYDVVEYQSP